MVRRNILLALLVAVALLAVSGAKKTGRWGGGTYRTGGASYGVGVSAGFDTVTILFTMDSTYTSVAAADTHLSAIHNYWVQNADRVYILGTGNDVEDFAYGYPSRDLPNGYQNASYGNWEVPGKTVDGDGVNVLDIRPYNRADSAFPLVYIPVEDYIPSRSTIIKSDLWQFGYNTTNYSQRDTVFAVLMTRAGDSAWYTSKGITANYPNYSHVSWNNQISSNSSNVNWAASDSDAWSPAINDRTYFWDWGDYWDWTGGSQESPYTFSAQFFRVSLRRCTQAAVNGATNNGFALTGSDYQTGTGDWDPYVWDEYSQNVNATPFLVVKYITKRYSKFFGSSEWAAVFSTDDAKHTNKSYIDTVTSYGGTMTMFVAETQLPRQPGGNAVTAAMDSLTSWRSRFGIEVGTHSRHHRAGTPGGLAYYTVSDTGSAAYDSLINDASPEWFYAASDSFDGDERRSDPYWGKSMALPLNQWTPYVLRAVCDIGYEAVRVNSVNDAIASNNYRYAALATQRAADTDSLFAGVSDDHGREPRNMIGLPYTVGMKKVVGDTADAAKLTRSQVKHNFKRLAAQVIGDGRGVVSLFWHDDRQSTAGYGEAVDADDLGAMCEVVNELGGRYMRASEYARWIKAAATPVPTPTAYSQADSFRFDAVDRVWFVPNGVDNTPVRGVRATVETYASDTAAPSAPTGLQAFGGDGAVVLSWTASGDKDPVTYNVYRFYEGSQDTTTLATKVGSTFYNDATAINGTEHFYFVSASDAAQNESFDSDVASDIPVGSIAMPNPAYFAMWYQDAPASSPSSAQYDSLAAFDLITTGPFPQEGDVAEPFYAGMVDSLRSRNSDIIVLNYSVAVFPYTSWSTHAAGTPQRRTWDFLASISDSLGFGQNLSGFVTEGNAYPLGRWTNIMTAAYADTIARYYVDAYEDSGVDGTHTGFFVDLVDSVLTDGYCSEGCQSIMDFDQDGTEFENDADEKAAYKAFHLGFIKALRREFAERGMSDRLIVGNGRWGWNSAAVAKYLDGYMIEAWNQYIPGPQGSEATWENALAAGDLFVNSQTNPPLALWSARLDSSAAYISEPVALAASGLINVQDPDDYLGNNKIPAMVRRLPAPGAISSYDAANDTLLVIAANYTARLDINHTAADTYTVWPYLITAGTDTISRGGGWARAEDMRPVVAFSADVTSGASPLTVTFTDESTNSPTIWLWRFGDNGQSESTEQNPEFEFTDVQDYDVWLYATNAAGTKSLLKLDYISVTNPASAPDTSGTFVSAAFDTTNTSDIEIDLTVNPPELARVFAQWKNGSGGTWAPADTTGNWSTASAGDIVSSMATGLSTSAAAGDTFYTRYQLSDLESTPNISVYVGPIKKVFTQSVITGDLVDGASYVITGTGFGTNSSSYVWDTLEDGAVNTSATSGTWSSTKELTISTSNNRTAASSYNAAIDLADNSGTSGERWGQFEVNSSVTSSFVSYWWRADSGFAFGGNSAPLSNIKVARWYAGSNNLRVQLRDRYIADVVVEQTDVSVSFRWDPVISGTSWVNQIFGHAAPAEPDLGHTLGWDDWVDDLPVGTWHLFQFEFDAGTVNGNDGVLRWWVDGTLIFDRSDVKALTSAYSGPYSQTNIGWYNSPTGDDTGNTFRVDDAWWSDSRARVELSESATYNGSPREVQPWTAWADGSITIAGNKGAISSGTAYIHITKTDGTRVPAIAVTVQ